MRKILIITAVLIVALQTVGFSQGLIWNSQVIKRPDGAMIYKIDEGGSFESPTWLSDDKQVLFTIAVGGYENDYSNLYTLDVKTSETRQLTQERNMRISTENAQLLLEDSILFTVETNEQSKVRELLVLENDKTTDYVVVKEDHKYGSNQIWHPSLSPDKQWLVYDAPSGETLIDGTKIHQIYKRSFETGEVVQLTSGLSQKRRPRWSPDGYILSYEQYDGQFREWSLYITDFNGRHHRRFTEGMGDETFGSFSPDGQWLVYTTDEAVDGEELAKNKLMIQGLYNGKLIQLTEGDFFDTKPSWSPTGAFIVFQSSPKDPHDYEKSWLVIIPKPEEIELMK